MLCRNRDAGSVFSNVHGVRQSEVQSMKGDIYVFHSSYPYNVQTLPNTRYYLFTLVTITFRPGFCQVENAFMCFMLSSGSHSETLSTLTKSKFHIIRLNTRRISTYDRLHAQVSDNICGIYKDRHPSVSILLTLFRYNLEVPSRTDDVPTSDRL